MTLYILMNCISYNVHVLMRDEKEGRSKQARSNKQQGKPTQMLMRDEKEGRKKQARSNKLQSKATQHTQHVHVSE